MELWQTYHEISKRFHLTADNWGVTKKSVVSQFSSFGKEEYPQGEVVGEYAVHLFTANYRQPYFTYYPGFQPPLLPEGKGRYYCLFSQSPSVFFRPSQFFHFLFCATRLLFACGFTTTPFPFFVHLIHSFRNVPSFRLKIRFGLKC